MTLKISDAFGLALSHVRADPLMFVVAMLVSTMPPILADFFLDEASAMAAVSGLSLILLFVQIVIAGRCLRRANAIEHREVPKPTFYPRAFLQSIVGTFGILVGVVLFVLPGIFLFVRWFISLPALISRNTRAIDALHESWRMTKGNELPILAVSALAIIPALMGLAILFFSETWPAAMAFEVLASITLVGLWYLQIAVFQLLRVQPESGVQL